MVQTLSKDLRRWKIYLFVTKSITIFRSWLSVYESTILLHKFYLMARCFGKINWISVIHYDDNNDSYGQLCSSSAIYSGNSDCLFLKKLGVLLKTETETSQVSAKNISRMNIYVYHEIFMYFTRVVFPDHRKHNFLHSALNV